MQYPSLIPPSPSLLAQLYARYQELIKQKRLTEDITFEQFYSFWRSRRRGQDLRGLDDGHQTVRSAADAPQLIDRPIKKLKGTIRTIVLLVDFDDQPASSDHTPAYYKRMLFGLPGEFPTGSMREYFQNISHFDQDSGNGIDVEGEVHGWLRMPNDLSFYSNNASGLSHSYPRNAQGMARDAVLAALKQGVDLSTYDHFDEGQITALFIVHAGRGAEVTEQVDHIWSHKWNIPEPVTISNQPQVVASTYLTVPEDCDMGVCAHEWGHLTAKWADYYDTGNHNKSNGLGSYCLMAYGAWSNGGLRPTLPNGMLRMFHQWIGIQEITSSIENLVLKSAAEGGGVIVIRNEAVMSPQQYVLVEYRRKKGWDFYLPDEGIAVYLVDESIANVNNENNLAIELLQADGKKDLAKILFGNKGDTNDLYPSLAKRIIGKATKPSLRFPDGTWTGIKIKVFGTPGEDTMRINVEITKPLS